MLFKQKTLEAIACGSVTVAFRRWRRPTVREGGTLTTAVGVLAIDSVQTITRSEIGIGDVRAAGYPDVDALEAELFKQREGTLYRIAFHVIGKDPRVALRKLERLTTEELVRIRDRLGRWDRASPTGSWTREYLALIQRWPGTRAADLAYRVGVETKRFKANMRKLKELGLTESLAVGYRLSPRGAAVLKEL